MKIGINIKLDITKLDKARFFKGEKGTYCDLTAFIDTENVGQYGDNGMVTQAQTKEERADKARLPIVGNVKVFYSGAGKEPVNGNKSYRPPVNTSQADNPPPFDDSDIPF